MSDLFSLRVTTLLAICVLLYLAAAAQAVHACFVAMRHVKGKRGLLIWYEALITVSLALACATVNSVLENYGVVLIWLYPLAIPIEPLLWFNVVLAALGAVCAIRLRRPGLVCDAALLLCGTPPVINALGHWSRLLILFAAVYFTGRVCWLLAIDLRYSRDSVSRLSMVDAMTALPEGVLWMSRRHEVILMNDAMRSTLAALELPVGLSDAGGLWEKLSARAENGEAGGASVQQGADRLLIRSEDGTARLFLRDEGVLRHQPCVRVMALDVTEEETLNARLESVNRLLEAANNELQASVRQVRQVAEDEAVVRTKSRVHDTVGSRLSILHRYLEDERDSPESLAQITGLLSRILDDLEEPATPTAQTDLDSIRNAFSLAGVDVRLEGELPRDALVARAFVSIILEAITNAVKHAQARRVEVTMASAADGSAYLSVANEWNGAERIEEGTGIPGMRQMAQSVGATFSVQPGETFMIKVARQADADARPSVVGGAPVEKE